MNDTSLQDRRGAGRTVLVLSAALTLTVIAAVLLLLRTEVREDLFGDEDSGPRDQPLTARTVAAQVWEHLENTQLGPATGHDEVAESGDEEIHVAMWTLIEPQDFVVAVGRDDDPTGRPRTCAAAESASPTVRSCEEIDADGTTVLWLSSTDNPIGDTTGDGLTWTAWRVDTAQSVSVSLVITDLDTEPGRASGEDLPLSKDLLVEIAADPDLALLTTQDAVDRGEALGKDLYTG